VRVYVNPSTLAGELAGALNETDCLAAVTRGGAIEVLTPWLLHDGDSRAASDELMFFLRAWALSRAGQAVTLLVRD
jgi:hypothetical protein